MEKKLIVKALPDGRGFDVIEESSGESVITTSSTDPYEALESIVDELRGCYIPIRVEMIVTEVPPHRETRELHHSDPRS